MCLVLSVMEINNRLVLYRLCWLRGCLMVVILKHCNYVVVCMGHAFSQWYLFIRTLLPGCGLQCPVGSWPTDTIRKVTWVYLLYRKKINLRQLALFLSLYHIRIKKVQESRPNKAIVMIFFLRHKFFINRFSNGVYGVTCISFLHVT